MELQNKAVMVTGASRGLGRAVAIELAKAGARVVLTARHEEPLAAVVAEIRAAGGEAHAIRADVGDAAGAAEVAARATALVGGIDLAIHNASTLGDLPLPTLLDTSAENLEEVFAVNTIGPYALTRALAGSMLVRGGGLILCITSDAAIESYPGWGVYGASKAALEHLTRNWAVEMEGTGVRFYSVDPGEMDTRMHADAVPHADRSGLQDPGRVAARLVGHLRGDLDESSGSRLNVATLDAPHDVEARQ